MSPPTTVGWRADGPLDLARSVARYRRWGDDPVNVVEDGEYWRVAPDGVAYHARQEAGGAIVVTSTDPDAALANLRHRLAEALPRGPVERLAAADAVIGRLLAAAHGYRPPLVADPFEALVTSVTAQQVNLRWATTTRTRLVHRFGTTVELGERRLWAFPSPGDLAAADPQELRDLQLNWAKAHAIVGIAEAAVAGELDGLADQPSDEVAARLTRLRGVGPWTADWFLARCLGRPHAVAAGDLGVRKAVGTIYLGLDRPASEAEVRSVTDPWGDAANWAVHLLLEALA